MNAHSRSKVVKKTGKYKFFGRGGKKKAAAAAAPAKTMKYYEADDVKKPKNRNFTAKAPKVRASITPGTVLIVLSGRFRAKRVVFLKALDSGLLLVTGPYKVNGVPLRRLNQTYVIATSTKVDVSKVKVDHVNDEYFARTVSESKGEDEFFAAEAKAAPALSAQRKEDQKAVDAAIKLAPIMKSYLNAKFSLKKGQYPHLMKF